MVQPASKRLVTESTVAGHVAANLPARLGAVELDATIAKQARHANTIAFLGDSFTDMSEDTTGLNTYRAGRGFITWALQRLGQRLQIVSAPGTANGGITGQNTTQILARVQADVIDIAPGYCHVLAGTNDMIGGVAFATIQANLTAIFDAIDGAGIRLIAGTIAPYTGATTTQLVTIERINNFIREQARTRPGMILADYHAVLAGPDGNWRTVGTTAYTGDGTHASTGGAMRMGKVLADALANHVPAVNILPTSNVDSLANVASFAKPNMLTNPMFTGTAGTVGTQGATGQVADSWVISTYTTADLTGLTAAKVARTDGKAGEWQQFTHTSVAQKLRFQQTLNLSANLAAGDIVYAAIEYELSNITDLDLFRLQLATFDANNGYANRGTVIDLDLSGADINTIPLELLPTTGILYTPTLVIPANATGITFSFDVSAVGTIRLGRPVFRRTRP